MLPPIEVGKPKQTTTRGPRTNAAPVPSSQVQLPTMAQAGTPALFTRGGGSLAAPSIPNVRAELMRNVGSVAFVDSQAPEQQTRYLFDLRDSLKDTPGVYAESRYGQELRLSVRGSNLSRDYHMRGLELLQDGIPMTFADGSGDTYQIDPHYYRAIEVYKGGNGLTYGASTLGGAINFVSPTAYTAISPNYLNIEGGSFESIRGQAQASRIIGNFDILLNGTFSHAKGYRGHELSDYTQINGNAGWKFDNNLETRVYIGYYNTHQQIPGTLTLDETISNPTLSLPPFTGGTGAFYNADGSAATMPGQGTYGFSGNQGRYQQNYRVANKTSWDLGWGQIDMNSWFVGQYMYHPVFVVIQDNSYNWGATPRLTSTHEIFGHKNEVIAGSRIWGENVQNNWFTNINGGISNPYGNNVQPQFSTNAFGPGPTAGTIASGYPAWSWNNLSQFGWQNGVTACQNKLGYGEAFTEGFKQYMSGGCNLLPFISPGQNPQLRNNQNSAFNVELYGEDRFHISENVTAMAGLKYLSDRRAVAALGGIPFEPLAGNAAKTYLGLMPKMGLMGQITPDIQLFSDVTLARDVPDFIDLTQTLFAPTPPWMQNSEGQYGFQLNNLKAQKAWTTEVGTRGMHDRFTWDITYYYSKIWDELLKFNNSPSTGVVSVTRNAPNTIHQGIELGGSVEVLRDLKGKDAGDNIKISQIWNLNLYQFENDPVYQNNWLPAIPRNVLRTTVSYSTKEGLYIAPQVDWIPTGAFVDYANTLRAPGYAYVGIQAGLKMQNGLELYVDARNLNNVHYVSDVITVANAYAPPYTKDRQLYDWQPGNPRAFYPGNGASIFSGVKYRF
jgi:iron complex outermembrane receptor protein